MKKKKSLFIALILNIVVIPGSGHRYLGFKKRGLLLIIAVTAVFSVFAFHVVGMTQEVLQAYEATGNVLMDSFKLSKKILTEHVGTIKAYIWALVAIYIYSIVEVVFLNQKTSSSFAEESKIKTSSSKTE